MDVNVTEEMPDGSITFTGTLSTEEVSFLIKFGLMSLLSRGIMPASILVSGTTNDPDFETPDGKDLN